MIHRRERQKERLRGKSEGKELIFFEKKKKSSKKSYQFPAVGYIIRLLPFIMAV